MQGIATGRWNFFRAVLEKFRPAVKIRLPGIAKCFGVIAQRSKTRISLGTRISVIDALMGLYDISFVD
jgi:hypothetical protein